MLKQFRETDSQQQIYTRAFLESLVSASRIFAEVPQYSTQFLSVSKRLLDQGKIGKLDQNSLYVQGLSERIQRELFYRNNLNFDDNKRPIDLLIFIKQAERIVFSEQKFESFFKHSKERRKFDNFIEQLRAKPDASEGRVLQAPIAPLLVTTENESKDVSFSMDNLTNQLSAMMLALSHLNALNNNNVMPQRQNSVLRYSGGINPGGFGIVRRFNSENIASRNKCW